MRLLSWFLWAAAAIIPIASSEEKSVARPKRDSQDKKIVCYYTNWSVYRPGTAKFSPQNINPYLCTHLIYAFGGLSKDNALKPFDKYQDIEQGGYAKFNGLKTYNKNLKTMLAIGGWNEGSARFSPLVADAERRKELVKNTVKFLRQNHFDGLDLDWEYPSFRDGGKPRDRDNYATLVQEFREEFERESEKTGRTRLLLTMAVPAGIEYIDKGYDVPRLNKYLDWMNILSYDYHSAFEPAINHHSPLFSLEEDNEYNFDAQLSIDYTVKHYIKLGADRNKLVLGIPTYGRSYTLFNPDATDIGAPADGPGEQGEATREKGYLAYYEICERVKTGGWSEENPYPDAMGPYAYKDNQWVGYDDESIARAKAKYVNDNDLGGIMFWSIDNDDFRGKCHGKPYPIIEAAKEALLASANELVPSNIKSNSRNQKQSSSKSKSRNSRVRTKSTTTTEASEVKLSGRTTTTPLPPTTPDPGSDFVCKDEGFFPHPRDCKKYFWCLDSGPSSLGIVAHQFTCPSGLVFNKISDSCDYARNVICKNKGEPSITTTTTTSTTTVPPTTARTTTIRSKLVITASPPKTTSTTTTELPDEEEEEEVEDEEDEEDPGTIKELISLIKKLGGVEQLEKQLNLQNLDSKEKIKPSLYSKVLQGRTANRYRGVTNDDSSTTTQKYQSLFRNRPIAPQSSENEESNSRTYDKPKYVTIQRNRSTKKPNDYKEDNEEEEEVIEIQVQPKHNRPSRKRLNSESTTEKEYITLRRIRPAKSDEELTTTSRYKNVVRVRSTTEAALEEEEEFTEEEEDESGGKDREEEEDEASEEEFQKGQREEIESPQKFKKYSSIVRGKKISPASSEEEEETKVSGPGGVDRGNQILPTTTERIQTFHGGDDVNTVHKITSPKYVEIRRTQSPTRVGEQSSKNNVNIVHNSLESKQADREALENESLVSKKFGKFDPRSTVVFDTNKRPSFQSGETVATISDSFILAKKENEVQRFRGGFRSTTESSTTPEIKSFYKSYKTVNRSNTNNFSTTDSKLPSRFLIRERPTTTITTTSTTTPELDSSTNKVLRRFPFATRTRPTSLTFKVLQPTTAKTFEVTVPNSHLDSPYTRIALDGTGSSPTFPSVTLEPTTIIPSISENENFDEPENKVGSTGLLRTRASTRFYIPTTSTQTSVVTSITESLFTERGRILVPKRSRNNASASNYKFPRVSSITTSEPSVQTTRTSNKSTGYKTKSSSPKSEIAEDVTKRFKGKSTFSKSALTTSTEPSVKLNSRYVPKKPRNFKKIVSTEAPQTSTPRPRFAPQKRFRQKKENFNESLSFNSKFGRSRYKKVIPTIEENDLTAEQTDTYFGDGQGGRYYSGGKLRQVPGIKDNREALNAVLRSSEKWSHKTSQEKNESIEEEEKNSGERKKADSIELYTNYKSLRPKFSNDVEVKTTPLDRSTGLKPVTRIHRPNSFSYNLSPLGATTPISEDVNQSSSGEVTNFDEIENVTEPFIPITIDVNDETVNLSFQPGRTTKLTATGNTYFRTTTQKIQEFTQKNEEATSTDVSPVASTDVNDEVDVISTDVAFTSNIESKEKTFGMFTTQKITSSTNKVSVTPINTINSSNIRLLRSRTQQQGLFQRTRSKPDSKTEAEIKSQGEKSSVSDDTKKKNFFRFSPDRTRIFARNKLGKDDENRNIDSSKNRLNTKNFKNGYEANDENEILSFNRVGENVTSNGSSESQPKWKNFRKFESHTRTVESATSSSTTESIFESSGENQTSTTAKNRIRQLVKRLKVKNNQRLTSKSEYQQESNTSSKVTSPGQFFSGESTTWLKQPNLNLELVNGSAYGVKTGLFSEGTTSLFSSTVPTETPTTLGLFFRNSLRPIVITDSVISSSIDSAIRVPNVLSSRPTKHSTENALSTFEAIKTITPEGVYSTNQSETIQTNNDDAIPTTTVLSKSIPVIHRQVQKPEVIDGKGDRVNSTRWNFKNFKTRKVPISIPKVSKGAVKSENEEVANKLSKNEKRVLVRTRLIRPGDLEGNLKNTKRGERDQSEEDGDAEDIRTEAPPTTTTTSTTRWASNGKANQDILVGRRTRIRSTTTQTPTTERKDRRRTLLDRRRLKQDSSKSTTLKPEIISDGFSSTVRTNAILRKRIRPSTPSTTTSTTTTTTEAPYLEIQEDSSLEESKLDGAPEIQDLADPAVVAIHTLATISPGAVSSSGRPLTYFGPPAVTPDTYTVHVTPADIESITPGRVATIAPGTVRPTSILTLKPFTIPVITKSPAQSSSFTLRPSSPFRTNGISLVTEEPYISRDNILEQARRLEAIPQPRPLAPVAATATQKSLAAKSPRPKPFSKVPKQEIVQSVSSPDPQTDYEYYDEEDPLANIPASALKVKVHSNGYIECLDRGNFPHPFSCKKFISCAKMENNELLGWEYTCPKHLSFDPVGGICNWSAGLGCQH